MQTEMKNRYRKFRRNWGVYYAFDNTTGSSQSLKTHDKRVAERLVQAMNEAETEVGIRKQVGLMYLKAADPEAAKRPWQRVMDTAVELAPEKSRHRWETAIKDKAFNLIRNLPLVNTRSSDFLRVLAVGCVSTNVFLRRLQNLALDLQWLAEPVLKKRLFPKPTFKKKRAVTADEHRRIVERERNPERRNYYEVLWHTGGAQTDIASLLAENIDWPKRVLTFFRCKTTQPVQLGIGDKLAEVLRRLPASGPLFPTLCRVREVDRANEYRQRCRGLGIQGITLHSYRYSFAQRAKALGYPQRYAQTALGHGCKAVTEFYAADAQFVLPSLETYETAAVSNRPNAPSATPVAVAAVATSPAPEPDPKPRFSLN